MKTPKLITDILQNLSDVLLPKKSPIIVPDAETGELQEITDKYQKQTYKTFDREFVKANPTEDYLIVLEYQSDMGEKCLVPRKREDVPYLNGPNAKGF